MNKQKKRVARKAPQKDTPRPTYGSRFRARAKSLYLKHRSLAAVVRHLKREGYKDPPHRATLGKWRDEERWDDELSRLDRALDLDIDPDTDDFEKLYNMIREHRKSLQEDVQDFRNRKGKKKLTPNELTQLAHAINRAFVAEATILEKKKRLEAEQTQAVPTVVIFEALKKHDKIGVLLRKSETMEELRQLISEQMLMHQKRAVGIPA